MVWHGMVDVCDGYLAAEAMALFHVCYFLISFITSFFPKAFYLRVKKNCTQFKGDR